jgi:hypothetical protein
MIEPRELISATRQLGSMTEAGVDILRAIKVLRAQTQNPELLALYDQLAQELRLGSGLPEAMSHAPQAFSAFAVSLVRQGEARGDVATSFYRIADYLQKEREADTPQLEAVPVYGPPLANAAPQQCPLWLRRAAAKCVMALAGLAAVILALELGVALEIVPPRWHLAALAVVIMIFLLGAARGLRQREIAEPIEEKETPRSPVPRGDKSTFNSDPADKSTEATFE